MFKKAEKKKQKLRLALTGPSGSGKTYSALTMAFGVFGKNAKVCVIDTEHGSSELYSDRFPEYYVSQFFPPYSPDCYIKKIKEAEAFGADVIIIDSLSHEWMGQGGCLEMVDNIASSSSSKNSYTAWKNVTPKHQAFLDTILASRAHIIATMRAKQDYFMVEKNGKSSPQKMGLAPIQREGTDYEFTLVFDLPGSGNFMASASKDRTGLFTGKFFPLDEATCRILHDWLNSGQEVSKEDAEKQLADKICEKMAELPTVEALKNALNSTKEKYAGNFFLLAVVESFYERRIEELNSFLGEQHEGGGVSQVIG